MFFFLFVAIKLIMLLTCKFHRKYLSQKFFLKDFQAPKTPDVVGHVPDARDALGCVVPATLAAELADASTSRSVSRWSPEVEQETAPKNRTEAVSGGLPTRPSLGSCKIWVVIRGCLIEIDFMRCSWQNVYGKCSNKMQEKLLLVCCVLFPNFSNFIIMLLGTLGWKNWN